MRRAAILAVLAAALLASRAGALDPERDIAQYKHSRWTVGEGAPPFIYALAQGADGYLWIGSAAGLYRFDGVTFEPIPLRGPNASALRATALVAARDGAIWVGFHSGDIAVYRDGILRLDRSVPRTESQVASLAETRDGTVWAVIQHLGPWLLRRAGGRWAPVGRDWGIAGDRPGDLFADRDGSLWVLVDQNVLVLREGARRFERVGRFTGDDAAIGQDPSGRIWLSDDQGSRVLSGAATDAVFPTPGFPGWVNAVQFDRDGNLWGVNGLGLFRLRTPGDGRAHSAGERAARVALYTARDGLTADTTMPLLEDREGNLWVGTSLGLDQLRNARIVAEPRLTAMPGFGFGLLGASDGSVYVGAANALYRVAPGGAPELVATPASPELICEAADRSIWVFSSDGALRIERGTVRPADAPGLVAARRERRFLDGCAVDDRGTLWVNATEAGLFSHAAGQWRHYPPNGDRWAMTLTPGNGRPLVWLKSGMLARLGADGRPEAPLLRRRSSDMHFIQQGRHGIFLGGPFGLGRVDQGRFETASAERFPWLADPYGLVETPEGQTWVLARAGIVGLATADLDRAFANPQAQLQPVILGFDDGLPNVRTVFRRGGARGGDGRLWFATYGGVVWIDPARLARNAAPPPVRIRALVANGLRHRDPAQLTLAKGTSSLAVQYTGLSLTMPQRVRFRYRLEGVDEGWIDAGARREAYYTNLGPGTYRFQVVAANNDGVWNNEGATLDFTVPPTFLQSIWFKLLCLLGAGLLLWLLYRARVRQVGRGIRLALEQRLAERERIARELHDTLLQSVQGLTLFFQSIANRVPPGSDLREPIEKALGRADATLFEGRKRVRELRSAVASHDLAQALRDATADLVKGDAPRFTVIVEGEPRPLHGVVGEETLRIGEEAVRNAVRHAGATRIEAILTYGSQELRMIVRDDGVGIPDMILSSGERDGHYGLIGMRERAAQIGGRLGMTSQAGAGTEVTLWVPALAAYRERPVGLLERLRLRRRAPRGAAAG